MNPVVEFFPWFYKNFFSWHNFFIEKDFDSTDKVNDFYQKTADLQTLKQVVPFIKEITATKITTTPTKDTIEYDLIEKFYPSGFKTHGIMVNDKINRTIKFSNDLSIFGKETVTYTFLNNVVMININIYPSLLAKLLYPVIFFTGYLAYYNTSTYVNNVIPTLQ
jgi:hypothetical protein